MEPFAVVSPGHGEAFECLARMGCKAFRFIATGVAVVNFPRGYRAEEFAHITLTVWAANEAVSKPAALRQLAKIAPAYRWSVSTAPDGNEDRKAGGYRRR